MTDAGMQMPALLFWMPMPTYVYHKIYKYFTENLPHFGGILCIFGEF
jgi:hypothetical protein